MPQIQKLEPSRVIHELILKPFGTYLIRSPTENDDILSQISIKPIEEHSRYVVLSVRVDENRYHYPIINYRLPFIEGDDEQNLIEDYNQIQDTFKNDKFQELEKECIIETEDTDWQFNEDVIQTQYRPLFSSNNNDMGYSIKDENREIKLFKKQMNNDEQEFSILKTLSYFHIVTFYGICNEIDHTRKFLVFADNGESLKIKYTDDNLTIKQLTMIGYQIACGMIYLEKKNIIHRDLHAGNILIDEQNFIRIADFEHAIIIDDENDRSQQSRKNSKSEFKIRRLAPECLPQLPENDDASDSYKTILDEFSSKSDVWAYGLIFIELLLSINDEVYSYVLGKSAAHDDKYEETDQLIPHVEIGHIAHNKPDDDDVVNAEETRQLVQYIKIDRNIHRKPDNCLDTLYDVLKRCWKYCPNDRISFMHLRDEMSKIFESEKTKSRSLFENE
jgi:serine/threonine protein kinase